MSKYFQRMLYRMAVGQGAKLPFVQRVAEKAVRMERQFTGEKAGLWLGAAAREVSADISSSYNTVRSYLQSTEATPPQHQHEQQQRVKARAESRRSDGSGGAAPPRQA